PRRQPPRHLHSFPTRRSSDLSFCKSVTNSRRLFAGTLGCAVITSGTLAAIEIPAKSVSMLYGARFACASATEASGKVMLCIRMRSEEHTSELQSRFDLVCRLL